MTVALLKVTSAAARKAGDMSLTTSITLAELPFRLLRYAVNVLRHSLPLPGLAKITGRLSRSMSTKMEM